LTKTPEILTAALLGLAAAGGFWALTSAAPAAPARADETAPPAFQRAALPQQGPVPPPQPPASAPRWLVGDVHVHVSPPDAAGHSSYTVASAIRKARDLELDFVILAPHDADQSFGPSEETGGVPLFGQELVEKLARETLAAPAPAGGTARPILVVPGWEFTRPFPGHQTLAFFAMQDVSRAEGDLKPEKVIAKGGLAIVNHPYFRPVKMEPLFQRLLGSARVEWAGDWRWKPFFGDGVDPLQWNAIEVWHERSSLVQKAHAQAADRYPDTQMVRDALGAWDRATRTQRRRIVGVGGSDCHGKIPYAVVPMKVTSVAVASFDLEALRKGFVGGHVAFGADGGASVRDFAATSDVAGECASIGDALRARAEVRLTWSGKAVLYEDGARVGEIEGGCVRKVEPAESFHAWRIEKPEHDAYSNMIYANLPR
jgi:hypothetical protein